MPKKEHGHKKEAAHRAQEEDQANVNTDAQAEGGAQDQTQAHVHAKHKHHHHGPHYTGDTVNLLVDAESNLVTQVFYSTQTDTGCEIVPGVTSFTDTNSCLYQQGFRIVASLNDDEGEGAVYTYVR